MGIPTECRVIQPVEMRSTTLKKTIISGREHPTPIQRETGSMAGRTLVLFSTPG
jgi:hypothetical protein